MAELANSNHIRVVLSSVMPVYDYSWEPGLQPAEKIVRLNSWIKSYCQKKHFIYLDYFSSLADERNGMKAALTVDGVHANMAGYKVMEPLAESAIHKALK